MTRGDTVRWYSSSGGWHWGTVLSLGPRWARVRGAERVYRLQPQVLRPARRWLPSKAPGGPPTDVLTGEPLAHKVRRR